MSSRNSSPPAENTHARAAYIALVIIVLVIAGYGITRLSALDQSGSVVRSNAVFVTAAIRAAPISVGAAVATVICSLLAGSALSQRKRVVSDSAAPLAMSAGAAILLPLDAASVFAGTIGTTAGLLIAFLFAALPLSIWQAKTAYDRIPPDVEDAAMLDGCSGSRLFRLIILPTIAPAVAAIAIFSMISAWLVTSVAMLVASGVTSSAIANRQVVLVIFAPALLLFLALTIIAAPKLKTAARARVAV
jgi:ABC-type glycerol-3-phosphate transport system permease component